MPYRRLAIMTAAMLAGIAAAGAHAQLDHASPAVGSVVHTAPRQVSLSFTEKLEPAFSRIDVYDAGGKLVSRGKAQVDRAQPKVLRVGLRPLPPGRYRVRWRVISVDTHKSEGSFSFDVRP